MMGTLILKSSALSLFPPRKYLGLCDFTSLSKISQSLYRYRLEIFKGERQQHTQPLTSRRKVSGINEHISRVACLVVHIVRSEAKRRVRPSQSQLLVKNKTDILKAKNSKIRSLLPLSSDISRGSRS